MVYNLSVADVHEYYANGVLVSNCDTFRYYGTHKFAGLLDGGAPVASNRDLRTPDTTERPTGGQPVAVGRSEVMRGHFAHEPSLNGLAGLRFLP